MRRPIRPDFLYRLDQQIANRADGGTVSTSMSESLGIPKSVLHAGMVGGAGVAAAVKLAKASNDPLKVAVGFALIGLVSKAIFDYVEAPRR